MLVIGRLSRQLCFAHDFETWQANSLSCSTMNSTLLFYQYQAIISDGRGYLNPKTSLRKGLTADINSIRKLKRERAVQKFLETHNAKFLACRGFMRGLIVNS